MDREKPTETDNADPAHKKKLTRPTCKEQEKEGSANKKKTTHEEQETEEMNYQEEAGGMMDAKAKQQGDETTQKMIRTEVYTGSCPLTFRMQLRQQEVSQEP